MPSYDNFAMATMVYDILIHFSVIGSNFKLPVYWLHMYQ